MIDFSYSLSGYLKMIKNTEYVEYLTLGLASNTRNIMYIQYESNQLVKILQTNFFTTFGSLAGQGSLSCHVQFLNVYSSIFCARLRHAIIWIFSKYLQVLFIFAHFSSISSFFNISLSSFWNIAPMPLAILK